MSKYIRYDFKELNIELNSYTGTLGGDLGAPLIQMQGLVEAHEYLGETSLASFFRATIHPDIKRTLVAISERTGMSVSQVSDEVLYTGLIKIQELDDPERLAPTRPTPSPVCLQE